MVCGDKILVMGGASEAHRIVNHLSVGGRQVIACLPEHERSFAPLAVPTRVGRFADLAQLKRWLEAQSVACVIDASHAFDDDIARMTAAACEGAGLRYVRVLRPAWRAGPQDDWTPCETLRRAAQTCAPGARVFSNTGRATLDAFRGFQGAALFLRRTRPSDSPPPFAFAVYVEGTPPFSQDAEEALFRRLQITQLICRNVGGTASISKLLAARSLELPVAMIDRPPPPAGAACVETVAAALAWEARQ